MTTIEAPRHSDHSWIVDVASRRVMKRPCLVCDETTLAEPLLAIAVAESA
jgi:hypothetical protein